MRAIERRSVPLALLALAVDLAAATILTGCGTPGAPLPPSLKLPDPVTNLAAVRAGDQVALTWTMPRKNTDKLLIKSKIPVQVCRREASGPCQPVAANLSFAPNANATFTDTLSPELASGSPRPLAYFVEALGPRGRSAGPSNAANVLAGEAPGSITGLSAQLRKDGVVLHWSPESPTSPNTVVRLHRKLVTPRRQAEAEARQNSPQGPLAPAKESVEQSLLVESSPLSNGPPDRTIDRTIRFGQTYEYRVQRVARVTIDGQAVELAGPLSEPIQVQAIDTFPPAVPTGLAAVATAPDSPSGPSIDLSWQPVAETDLAGYAVYRREGDGPLQRISPPQPVVGPGFHDPQVQPGHTYRYAVTAIDQLGHESARSEETEESAPNQ